MIYQLQIFRKLKVIQNIMGLAKPTNREDTKLRTLLPYSDHVTFSQKKERLHKFASNISVLELIHF